MDIPSVSSLAASGNESRLRVCWSVESLQLEDESWKILKGLSYSPKTAQMLARIYGIPIADCWKHIHFLEGLGLIRVVLIFVSREGRVLQFYETGDQRIEVVVGESAGVYFNPLVQ